LLFLQARESGVGSLPPQIEKINERETTFFLVKKFAGTAKWIASSELYNSAK
jgi:hypothetical protein